MIWNSWSDFWSMGGYGLYVWGSMGVTGALLALEIILTRRGRQQALQQVRQELQAPGAGQDWHS